MWSNHSVLILQWISSKSKGKIDLQWTTQIGTIFFTTSFHNKLCWFFSSCEYIFMKMYIQCYSAVGQKSHPPIHQSNLHCFLLGVKDSKINGATLQPKWLWVDKKHGKTSFLPLSWAKNQNSEHIISFDLCSPLWLAGDVFGSSLFSTSCCKRWYASL